MDLILYGSSVLHKLVESVSARVHTVIKAERGETKYYEIHVNISNIQIFTFSQVIAD